MTSYRRAQKNDETTRKLRKKCGEETGYKLRLLYLK
jgi:hypothetical protein